MVCWEYCDHVEGKNLVNHKDGIKQNNYYKNLEYTTPKENTQHAILHGLQTNCGPHCPSAVYSEETVRFICKSLEDGDDCKTIYTKLTGDDTITNKAVYMLIFSIKEGKRHVSISSKYKFSKYDVKSKAKPKFNKHDEKIIIQMLKEGKTTAEIVAVFGSPKARSSYGKKLYDKIYHERKKLKKSLT